MNLKVSTRFLYTFTSLSEPFRKQSLARYANSNGGFGRSLRGLFAYANRQSTAFRPLFPSTLISRRIYLRLTCNKEKTKKKNANTSKHHHWRKWFPVLNKFNCVSPSLFLSHVCRLRAVPFSRFFQRAWKNTHSTCSFFFLPCVSGILSRSLRATPFNSNGSAFFTSKRVFHTHVTRSVKTDWKRPRVFKVLSSETATKAEITI